MGLNSILKKVGVLEDVPDETTTSETVATTPTQPATTFTPSTNESGVFDQQIYDSLTKAIADKDMPGNDYLEFKASLKNLQIAGLSEEQMFKAAFAVLSANGLTKDILFRSLDVYLSVLDSEKTEFKDTLMQVTNQKIAGKQKELADNDLKAEELRRQIETINQQLKVIQANAETLTGEINDAKNKIAATEANFNKTFNTLVGQLTTDKEKITKYIA